VLMQMLSIEDAPMMMVSGREWGRVLPGENLKLVEGPDAARWARSKRVVLGRLAAEVLKKKVGDKVQIEAGKNWPWWGIVDGQGRGGERGCHPFAPGPASGHRQRRQGELYRRPASRPNTSKEEVAQLSAKVKEIFPLGPRHGGQ